MNHACIFLAALLGFSLLALAMDRHQEDLFDRMLARRISRALRIGGWIALLAALAIAVGNAVLMLQYATYSVISPEGCASILWRSADKAPDAAEALAITAPRLKDLELVDRVVNEPVGGAHRDPRVMARLLRRALGDALRQLQGLSPEQLVEQRVQRVLSYGRFQEARA